MMPIFHFIDRVLLKNPNQIHNFGLNKSFYPDNFSSAEYSPGLIFTLDAFSERGFVPFFTIIVADTLK